MRPGLLLGAAEAFSFSVGLRYLWRGRLGALIAAFCTIAICPRTLYVASNSKSSPLPCFRRSLNVNLLSFKQNIGLCKPNTMICVMSLFKFLLCFIKLLYLYTVVQVLYVNISSEKLNGRKNFL